MSIEPFRADLVAALESAARWLESCAIPAVVVGGVAASILGRARFTQDVDFLADAPESRWAELVAAASKHGLSARIPDAMAFAHRPRDLDDLAALLAANPQADIAVVRQWVREFASAASMPDILADFERLLSASRSPDKA